MPHNSITPFCVTNTTLSYWSPTDNAVALYENSYLEWIRVPSNLIAKEYCVKNLYADKDIILLNIYDDNRNPSKVLLYNRFDRKWQEMKDVLEARYSLFDNSDKLAILSKSRSVAIVPKNNLMDRNIYVSYMDKCFDWDYDISSRTVYQLQKFGGDIVVTKINGHQKVWRLPHGYVAWAIIWHSKRKELWVAVDGTFSSTGIVIFDKNGRVAEVMTNQLGHYGYFQPATPKMINVLQKSPLTREITHY